jgi:hypothetical protein
MSASHGTNSSSRTFASFRSRVSSPSVNKLVDDCIDDLDRALNPLGRFFRHGAMHNGTTPMMADEFGRCARCVKLGFWEPDA